MAGYPPKKNTALTYWLTVVSQADTDVFQSNPTIAAGDFKVSTDGSAFTNLATLPDNYPIPSAQIRLQLSAAEMNGDVITVIGHDQAGDEWQDVFIQIFTDTTQIGELATTVAALNNLSAAQVNSEVDTALADYDSPTKTELDTGLAALNDITAESVWTFSRRNLTASAKTTINSVSGSTITISKYCTLDIDITGLTLTDASKIWFTIKDNTTREDTESRLQVEYTATGGTTVVKYVNEAAASTAQSTLATLTPVAATGILTIELDGILTGALDRLARGFYDIKVLYSDGSVTQQADGKAVIEQVVTRTVS